MAAWAMWGGEFATSRNILKGTVWQYETKTKPKQFIIRFPTIADTDDLGVTFTLRLRSCLDRCHWEIISSDCMPRRDR